MTHFRPGALAALVFVLLSFPAAAQQNSDRISEAECSVDRLGSTIDVSLIGEPVAAVTISPPAWNASTDSQRGYCSVDGQMAPIDPSPNSRPINFRVAFPVSWNGRSAQLGGGGMNGVVPNLASGPLSEGYVTYGSDSGHQAGGFGRGRGGARGGAAAANTSDDWTLNDEAIRNLGYMQMKKTRDAAAVLIERMYGRSAEFNYYIGSSQGGREALTVASRYPEDYDGITANVPIVGFSSLMLAPVLIRIQEKPLENWVTPAKVNAIRNEFIRQCDGMDGLTDGIINNYMACRNRFDVSEGDASPWVERRCPGNVDPNPEDTSITACLTDGQIETLEFVYSPYPFATELAYGAETFGMWVPNTDPSGSGLIVNTRFRGQEGTADPSNPAEDAPLHTHLGTLGVTGFLMRDLDANSLDYVEGGAFDRRRVGLSAILDGTNPDFTEFLERGGRMIVAIGTNDTLASPGAQLDFYQSVIDTMGRDTVDGFARFFVLPQTGHGLSGTSATMDGDGNAIEAVPIPNSYDRLAVLTDWVERGIVPGKQIKVMAGERSLPMCSYPEYPRYAGGPEDSADSYRCSRP